jgi:four helix bundle protein
MEYHFDHEKLKAYQQAIQFIAWTTPLIEQLEKSIAVRDQLDRASISIPRNIAEGNVKFSMKERCRYLDTAYGSALECAAALDVLVAQKRMSASDVRDGKLFLYQIVSLVMGLRNSAQNRIAEEAAPYGLELKQYLFDHEKLEAYRQAIRFIEWVTPLIDQLKVSKTMLDRIDRSSTSVPLNIAEGNAKFSMKERSRFLDIANNAAVDCAATLDVLVAQKRLKEDEIRDGKLILRQIVSLVIGLRNDAQSRINSELGKYGLEE